MCPRRIPLPPQRLPAIGSRHIATETEVVSWEGESAIDVGVYYHTLKLKGEGQHVRCGDSVTEEPDTRERFTKEVDITP
jgi:hypothetical protein